MNLFLEIWPVWDFVQYLIKTLFWFVYCASVVACPSPSAEASRTSTNLKTSWKFHFSVTTDVVIVDDSTAAAAAIERKMHFFLQRHKFTLVNRSQGQESLSLLWGVTHSRLMVSRFATDSRDLARNYNHANLIKKSPKANPIGIHCQGWFQEAPRKCGTNRGLRVTSPRKSRSLVRFMADTQQLVKGGQLGNHTRKIGFWAVYCRNTQCATWSDVGDGREA